MIRAYAAYPYRLTFGLMLSLIGISAIIRSEMGLHTTTLNLWPTLPMAVGGVLVLRRRLQENRSKTNLLIGLPLLGTSLVFSCFTLEIVSWSKLSVLWPVFPFIAGITFIGSAGDWKDKVRLTMLIVGWMLAVNALLFMAFTHHGLPWRFWPASPILTGLWIFLAQRIVRYSVTWTVLGLISCVGGCFLIPFAAGMLSWNSLANYQFVLFFFLSLSFLIWSNHDRDRRRGILYTSFILFVLSLLMLAGPLLIGWERFGWNLWPVMLILVGVGLSSTYGFDPKTWAALIPGVILLIGGAFLWLFTSGQLPWYDLLHLWPTFPLAIGLSFVLAAMSGGRSRLRMLFWIGVMIMLASALLYVFALWPVGLLLVGLILLIPIPRVSRKATKTDPVSVHRPQTPTDQSLHS
ncbi:MAG: hypothetical protein C4527_24925 [Candidatus Omnitrophota bacterium]|jgi:hypothetical protein|nr:MAG: hypothetical protein C4527_24925 [Candidatus Omnitrophota bacterium]